MATRRSRLQVKPNIGSQRKSSQVKIVPKSEAKEESKVLVEQVPAEQDKKKEEHPISLDDIVKSPLPPSHTHKPSASQSKSEASKTAEATPHQEDSNKNVENDTTVVEENEVREEPVRKPIFEKPLAPIIKHEKKSISRQSSHKKKKLLPSASDPPDRSTMKMMDLIYWNPSSNPMKKKASPSKAKKASDENLTSATEEEIREDTPGEEQSEDSLPVPQVTIGPDGNIVLNEASLVVDNKTNDEPMEAEVIEEDESTVNYKSFREKRPKSSWNELETKKFYKALSTVGTDFSLMLNLFPNRTRREIKNKFKKEERYNRKEVDKAIKNRTDFDMTDFEKFELEVEEEQRRKEAQAESEKEKPKKERKKRKSRTDDVKENKAVRKPKKRKKKINQRTVEDDETDTESSISDLESSVNESSSRVDEVVEILIDMSQGRVQSDGKDNYNNNNENDVSDAESDVYSVASESSSVFVPRNVRQTLKQKIKGDVEEDRTIDNQIHNDVEPTGDIHNLVSNILSEPSNRIKKEQGQSPSVKSNTPLPDTASGSSVKEVQSAPTEGIVTQTVQNMVVPDSLMPLINSAGGADKVQIVLVHETDATSGQTVVHVYIQPKSTDVLPVGHNTVSSSPTNRPREESENTGASCSSSQHSEVISQSSSSPSVSSSPVTPYQRTSSRSVTLAQTAAISTVKTKPQTVSSPVSSSVTSNLSSPYSLSQTSSLLTPESSHTWSDKLGMDDVSTSQTSSPSSIPRVCLFKDEPDLVDLTVKKEEN